MKTKIILILLLSVFPVLVFGATSKVRVFYHPDGRIAVMYFVKNCSAGETEQQCMDRIAADSPSTSDLPYDDLAPSQLPPDRSQRDKWRGAKGQGVWIDNALITKTEKLDELKAALNSELDKITPDAIKALKLQREIEILKEIDAKNNLLSAEQLRQFSETIALGGIPAEKIKRSFFDRIKDVFSFIFFWK